MPESLTTGAELIPPSLEDIRAARRRLQPYVLRTPLVRVESTADVPEITLKLENLQPTGSFKLRGAGNAMLSLGAAGLQEGVWTASAGNMAQGVAWFARRLGVACRVLVPEDIPTIKLEAIRRLGSEVVKIPFADYQNVQVRAATEGQHGALVHPFADRTVMAGNATIALEILEDLPEVDTILAPYGGGGLSCGMAAALRAAGSRARLVAVEVETAAPLAASLRAGKPVRVPYQASFISGIGAPFVFPQMWPLASRLIDDVVTVSLAQVAEAVRTCAQRAQVVAEGAGAVALAAALSGKCRGKRFACLVSGGNIDANVFATILQGGVP